MPDHPSYILWPHTLNSSTSTGVRANTIIVFDSRGIAWLPLTSHLCALGCPWAPRLQRLKPTLHAPALPPLVYIGLHNERACPSPPLSLQTRLGTLASVLRGPLPTQDSGGNSAIAMAIVRDSGQTTCWLHSVYQCVRVRESISTEQRRSVIPVLLVQGVLF